MNSKRAALAGFVIITLGAGAALYFGGQLPSSDTMTQRLRGQHTVADRQTQFGPAARALATVFPKSGRGLSALRNCDARSKTGETIGNLRA